MRGVKKASSQTRQKLERYDRERAGILGELNRTSWEKNLAGSKKEYADFVAQEKEKKAEIRSLPEKGYFALLRQALRETKDPAEIRELERRITHCIYWRVREHPEIAKKAEEAYRTMKDLRFLVGGQALSGDEVLANMRRCYAMQDRSGYAAYLAAHLDGLGRVYDTKRELVSLINRAAMEDAEKMGLEGSGTKIPPIASFADVLVRDNGMTLEQAMEQLSGFCSARVAEFREFVAEKKEILGFPFYHYSNEPFVSEMVLRGTGIVRYYPGARHLHNAFRMILGEMGFGETAFPLKQLVENSAPFRFGRTVNEDPRILCFKPGEPDYGLLLDTEADPLAFTRTALNEAGMLTNHWRADTSGANLFFRTCEAEAFVEAAGKMMELAAHDVRIVGMMATEGASEVSRDLRLIHEIKQRETAVYALLELQAYSEPGINLAERYGELLREFSGFDELPGVGWRELGNSFLNDSYLFGCPAYGFDIGMSLAVANHIMDKIKQGTNGISIMSPVTATLLLENLYGQPDVDWTKRVADLSLILGKRERN